MAAITIGGQIIAKQFIDENNQTLTININNAGIIITVPFSVANTINIGDVYTFVGTVQPANTPIPVPVVSVVSSAQSL